MTYADLKAATLELMGLDATQLDGDEFFTPAALGHALNFSHRHLAERALLYRKLFCLDVPVGEDGTSSVPLTHEIIRIIGVPRFTTTPTAALPDWQHLAELDEGLVANGWPRENTVNVSSPTSYFIRSGILPNQAMFIELAPGITTAVSSGLHFDAYFFPPLLASDGEAPAMQPGLHEYLLPGACRYLSQMNQGRGDQRPNALAYWSAREGEAIQECKRIAARGRRAGYAKQTYVEAH